MSPSLITLILNVVLGVFILFGFLGGLRGIKKSTFSLVVFIVNLIIVFFLTPVFSNIALNLVISGKSIYEHITGAIYDMVGSDMAQTDFVKAIAEGIPPMIANIVVSMLLIIAFSFVLKIIGAIVYKIMYRKDKEKIVEKCEIVNGTPQMIKTTVKKKKHRLAGGLVGAFHGFLFTLVMFFPICGLVNIFNDVIGLNKASAESSAQIQYFDEMIQENIPTEILDYAKAVDNSIIFKIGKIGNISEASFNIVSKNKINGYNVSLGQEIRTFVKAYDTFVDFARSSSINLSDYSFENIFNDMAENPQNYDFDKLYLAIDTLFDSNILNATSKDILKFAGDMLVEGSSDEQTEHLMTHIKNALYSYSSSDAKIKDDVKSLVSVFEVSAKSGLIKVLNKEEVSIHNLKSVLLNKADEANNKQENEVLNKLSDKLSNSVLLQKFILEFTNYGIEELEKEMEKSFEFKGNEKVELQLIDTSKEYSIKASELSSIVVDAINLLEELQAVDGELIEEDVFNIFDADLKTIVKCTGNVLNDVISLSILKDTGVFASICDQMARTEYNDYINFQGLKNANTVKTQFNYLADSIGAIKESQIINDIRYIDSIEGNDDRIKSILENLAKKEDGTTTYISKIVSPLLKCDLFKSTLVYGLDEAHKYLEQELIKINPDATLNKFNTIKLMTDEENINFINLLNNLVEFANGVEISTLLTNDFIDNLLASEDNIANLGKALDSVKNSSLFVDYNNQDGVYKNIMDALSGYEVFNEFFDFNVAKENGFSWNITTQSLIELKRELDDVYVSYNGEQVKLLKYILTNGDYNDLVDSLNGQEINLTNLFELDVLKPTSVKVINIINTTIKDFIDDESITSNIVDIDLTANISAQSESINAVINKALKLDFNKNIDDYSDNDIELVDNLLDALKLNAELVNESNENYGVFKDSYNALLIKVTNEINSEIKTFVGDNVFAETITMLTSSDNVTSYKDDIVNILKQAIKIDLDSLAGLEELTVEQKEQLNNLLDAMEVSAVKEGSPFAKSYNALLIKSVNLINSTIKSIVGDAAGSEIVEITTLVDLSNDVQKIRNVLDGVMDVAISDEFNDIDMESLNIEKFFDFIDLFKVNSNVANNIFLPTYNSLLVYIINSVNTSVANETDSSYTNYNGTITPNYNYTKEVVECGKAVFELLDDNTKLEDLNETDELNAFMSALEINEYTNFSHLAIKTYLISMLTA